LVIATPLSRRRPAGRIDITRYIALATASTTALATGTPFHWTEKSDTSEVRSGI
jgi:hypothetical protein